MIVFDIPLCFFYLIAIILYSYKRERDRYKSAKNHDGEFN